MSHFQKQFYTLLVYNIMRPENQDQRQQSFPSLSEFLKQIPFGCRIIYATLAIVWSIDLVYGFVSDELVADPQSIFSEGYQLWRLFTASFSQTSMMILIINIISLHTVLPKLEFRMNTAWILINYICLGFVIQTIFSAITFWFLPFKVAHGDSCGIWFNFMFKYCYFNRQNKIKFCCFPFMVPKIVYPFLMFLILSLMDFFQTIRFDIIIGISAAAIQCIFLSGNLFRCANNCSCCKLGQFQSWIEASSARTWPGSPYAGLQQDLGRIQQNSDDENPSPFKNKKGVRLDQS